MIYLSQINMTLALFVSSAIVTFFYSYLPGRIIVSFFPFERKVKLVLSFGISIFLFYLLGLSSYIFNFPSLYSHIVLWLLIGFLLTISVFRSKPAIVKEELILLGILFLVYLFTVSIQALYPMYGVGRSYWDWYEYFYRSKIFLEHLDHFTNIGPVLLPQRMPLYNAAAAFIMSVTGGEYWNFQLVSTLFNLSVILPSFLIIRSFGTWKKNTILLFTTVSVIFL